MITKNKKGFEMSFSTIFALIAGAAILFLALFFAAKFIGTQQTRIDAQTTTKLAVLMDPLKTGIGESESNVLNFASRTRLYNDRCLTEGNFGSQEIGIASESFGKFKEPFYGKAQQNKHIFSEEIEEGKEFYVYARPFTLPFKVSDLLILTSQDYCFVNAPESIEEELESLNARNLNFTDSAANCPKDNKKVCFPGSGCDISVYGEFGYKRGYVSKDGKKMSYIDSLLYAAIFSSPAVYECNVKRLKMRAASIASVYQDEIKVLERVGCSSNLDASLSELIALANQDSGELELLQDKAKEIEGINSAEKCEVFES